MKMEDMVIVSVDDHISEPPDLFKNHLSGVELESAPKFLRDNNGKDAWTYQGKSFPSVGLNAVVGRPFDEYGMEPTALEQLREGATPTVVPVHGLMTSKVLLPSASRRTPSI